MSKQDDINWDLKELSDEALRELPLSELMRVRNKRWANRKTDLVARAEAEIARRDPRKDWKCLRCDHGIFHEKEIRVSGGLASSWLGVETERFHAIVCNYCGKTEFYSVLMSGAAKAMDFLV